MIKIMFVCHGNICRSPMAEYVMKDIISKNKKEYKYYVASSATSREEIGNDIYPPAKNVLKKNNIKFSHHEAHQLTKDEYEEFDYIVIMEEYNLRNLKYIIPDFSKVYKLGDFSKIGEISDPWYSGRFDECYSEIKKSCEAMFRYLEEQNA